MASHIISTTLSGYGGGDFYPMENHMNKMRGGYGDQVSLEGPFSRGIAGAVSGWASEAKAQKVEQQNRLAEKQAALPALQAYDLAALDRALTRRLRWNISSHS